MKYFPHENRRTLYREELRRSYPDMPAAELEARLDLLLREEDELDKAPSYGLLGLGLIALLWALWAAIFIWAAR